MINKTKKILSLLREKPVARIIAIALVLLIVGAIALRPGDVDSEEMATFEAKRGPLTISVTESGTIMAREQVILKSEVEGMTTILWLIDEGVVVKKGDLLVELDASRLEDEQIDQEIAVQNMEAAFVGARENLAVTENQAQSDIDIAELTLDFAKQDLRKYVEGEYPNQLKEAQANITLAEEELTLAKDKWDWSKKLFEDKYVSQTELQADELSYKQKALNVDLAKNSLGLLVDFTNKRQMAMLESDVKQAVMSLERTNRKAKADIVQAQANLRAKESEFNRQSDKLAKRKEQIEKTKIYAPNDGRVVYATSAKANWRGNDEPLDEGRNVREREELIYLPVADSVKAMVKIHESSLKKIELGLPARLTIDALLGKTFTGYVAKIAPLPDAQAIWMNPDLKVYNTEIFINGDGSDMRTGMSCSAEIIVEHYKDAVYVPVQAVLRVKG
ncbi:MAG TPA: efflux transporter periplasmic adaptor subunit, partial [Phycisphaerales bacterium]|nr:efflux transporter periplasmic adaptor subunit [Phycisphaerales bacterium]